MIFEFLCFLPLRHWLELAPHASTGGSNAKSPADARLLSRSDYLWFLVTGVKFESAAFGLRARPTELVYLRSQIFCEAVHDKETR